MVAPHVPVPPMTIDVEVSVTRGRGEPRIALSGRNCAPYPPAKLEVSLVTAKLLLGDLQSAIARAEQGG